MPQGIVNNVSPILARSVAHAFLALTHVATPRSLTAQNLTPFRPTLCSNIRSAHHELSQSLFKPRLFKSLQLRSVLQPSQRDHKIRRAQGSR